MHAHVDRSDAIATFRLHLNASSSTDPVMASRVRTDCTKDEALTPSNTRTATERGHKTAPQRRRKSDNSELIMASVSESMMAPAVLKPPRPVTESRYLRRKGARGGRVDLLWLPSACKDNEARRTRQRASTFQPQRRCPMAADGSKQPVWLGCPPLWRGPGLHRRLCTLDAQLHRRLRHRRLLR